MHPVLVGAVDDPGGSAPVLSVMVPVYRPGDLLAETLAAARQSLEAAGVTWQLEVVDDASPNLDVAALLDRWSDAGRIGAVDFHRRASNGGLGACWNTCIERARGEFVHILHQDDLVEPGFHGRLLEAARHAPEAGMVFCRTTFREDGGDRLDRLEQSESGIVPDWLERICGGQRLQCPSVLVRRAVYDRIGGYRTDLRYIVDWEMWIRIAAAAPVAYVPDALAIYRIHSGAETRRIKAAGVVAKDAIKGLQYIAESLKEAGRTDCLPLARRYAIDITGYAAYDAEQAACWDVAAKELLTGLRNFWPAMRMPERWRQLRWYGRLRWNGWAARTRCGA